MVKSKSNISDLLAAIQRSTPATASSPEADGLHESIPHRETKQPAVPANVETPRPERQHGHKVSVWMHEDDRRLVRELAAWLAAQGVRTSDSMVIRAALRSAKTGTAFLEAFWEAAKIDGRLKRGS